MKKSKDAQSQILIERMTNYMSSVPPRLRMEPDHVLKIAKEDAPDLMEDEIAECYAAALSIARIHAPKVLCKTESMRQKMSAVHTADLESREDSGHRYADKFQRPDPLPGAPKKTCIMCGRKNTTGKEYRCVLCKSGNDATSVSMGRRAQFYHEIHAEGFGFQGDGVAATFNSAWVRDRIMAEYQKEYPDVKFTAHDNESMRRGGGWCNTTAEKQREAEEAAELADKCNGGAE